MPTPMINEAPLARVPQMPRRAAHMREACDGASSSAGERDRRAGAASICRDGSDGEERVRPHVTRKTSA